MNETSLQRSVFSTQRIATEEVKAAEYEGRAYVAGVAKKEATTLKDAKMPVDVQKQDQI